MIGKVTRAIDGEPLQGREALRERIYQLREQAKTLLRRAELLEALLAVLPPLEEEADAALAYLVSGQNR